ncbi:MAG TPA: ABC transporter substrate-binding protein [Streptosporangiaceae bacterium]|nr:ABC transporter substrate-binding protein [Streptosporangiaceae bacterium]
MWKRPSRLPGTRAAKFRRSVVGLSTLGIAGITLAACTGGGGGGSINNNAEAGKQSSNGLPKLDFKGTIVMAAGGYTPPLKGVKIAPGTVADPAMQQAANAFTKLYPGVHIKFVPSTAEIGTPQWYITQAAAGTLPDVSMVPGYYVNITLPTGIYEDLLPTFNKPNPFIPGNKKWIDTMNTAALHIDEVPGNTPGSSGIFVVNGDWGGIGFYYNKKLFAEAGISSPPTSWNQLVSDSQQLTSKLKSKGVYAGASFSPVIYNWFAHYFQANFLGLQKMQTINSIPATMGPAAQPYFYKNNGSWLNPAKNPKLTAWWPLGKQLTDTWAPKDVKVPENTAQTTPNGVSLFLGQQVAYALVSGYAIPSEVAALPKSQQFPVGYFEIKDFKGSSPYATDLSVWQDNGGPETAFQFGIASPKSDRKMSQAKYQAALAWLQFITTPKWDTQIVNGENNALPIIQGAKATPALQPILDQLNAESKYYYPIALFDSLTGPAFNQIDGLYLNYINGYVPLKQAISQYNSDADQIIAAYTNQHKQLIDQFTTYENKKLGIKG